MQEIVELNNSSPLIIEKIDNDPQSQTFFIIFFKEPSNEIPADYNLKSPCSKNTYLPLRHTYKELKGCFNQDLRTLKISSYNDYKYLKEK